VEEQGTVASVNGRPEGWATLTEAAVVLAVPLAALQARVRRGSLSSRREAGTRAPTAGNIWSILRRRGSSSGCAPYGCAIVVKTITGID
jgi:hypothetical protein